MLGIVHSFRDLKIGECRICLSGSEFYENLFLSQLWSMHAIRMQAHSI